MQFENTWTKIEGEETIGSFSNIFPKNKRIEVVFRCFDRYLIQTVNYNFFINTF